MGLLGAAKRRMLSLAEAAAGVLLPEGGRPFVVPGIVEGSDLENVIEI